MILADTSAWVQYDRATGSRVDQRLVELISENRPLAVTEPVIMEILAGARTDKDESDLRRGSLCLVSMLPLTSKLRREFIVNVVEVVSLLAGWLIV